MIDRRSFVAAAMMAPLVPSASLALPRRALGLQLYTLGDGLTRDIPAGLAAVRAIGFTEVELPSLLGKSAEEWSGMLRAAGLTCPSLHVPLNAAGLSLADTGRVASVLETLDARYAVVPIPPLSPRIARGETWQAAMARTSRDLGREGWERIAGDLDAAGRGLAAHGRMVAYHNHDIDLHELPGGGTPLETLMLHTDPRHVAFEMDIGWVVAAGRDPAALLRRHPNRFRLLHLKDTAKRMPDDSAFRMTPAEPGKGIVDWSAIRSAMRHARIDHAFVEQEPPFVGERIEAARRGYAFFSGLR